MDSYYIWLKKTFYGELFMYLITAQSFSMCDKSFKQEPSISYEMVHL